MQHRNYTETSINAVLARVKMGKEIPVNSKFHNTAVAIGSRLTITDIVREKGKKAVAKCVCSCGTAKDILLSHVKNGRIKSCGCLRNETSRITGNKNRKHGRSVGRRCPAYRSWEGMKSRCMNSSDPSFHLYGGRGIFVCDEWIQSFELFLHDMGERPRGTSLDRKNTDGNYEPENCRWATSQVQGRNKRNNRIVLFRGQSMTLVELSEITKVPYQRLHDRIVRREWTVEKAVTTLPRSW